MGHERSFHLREGVKFIKLSMGSFCLTVTLIRPLRMIYCFHEEEGRKDPKQQQKFSEQSVRFRWIAAFTRTATVTVYKQIALTLQMVVAVMTGTDGWENMHGGDVEKGAAAKYHQGSSVETKGHGICHIKGQEIGDQSSQRTCKWKYQKSNSNRLFLQSKVH